ncbi:response regulator receiver [Gordonia bronchialis DSM 43247]|jgi:DNA-binding NarL/FixJ family response regulator|uniref:Response regulator receiver n=1 Tax=Gordonia bronchialis (strain ATCC 25592 / DSM 43247 / BCRC 13721 / JCM 3198 / KCTC 3076 / NBRC 16047 / NCTC 10667) TaxID=526226 RepID=D0L8V7_GORB4|nr:response regulator transcription factor [Gordonia bronchialis]ACY21948.1 response regulator receiver [Gordonia bronchialis DSM 43247]MCC3324738.1 response regulator transcription factor [Gordonia bronchialis]QGS24471.1 response regulator [Gordonia bronchialis]UAK39236.1 response regulator transcription factor [Gordonia bronchialis]STQ64858.1 Response regulator protein vraR [Gordonia bronchialis]
MTARIMLVDDDPLVRSGLRLLLGGDAELSIVAEAADGQEALERQSADPVDMVLMDLRMPRMDGIAATAALKQLADPPNVIVLTTFDADDYVVRALAVGADGFLLKDTPPDEIVHAIKSVLAGRPALSPSVTAALIKQVVDGGGVRSAQAAQRAESLTERERDVAVELARGASNAEIAERLYMSLATVKAHISHIFTKLDATNRVQVAICMHDAGLA